MSPSPLLPPIPGNRGRQSLLAEARYWDAIVLGQPIPADAIDPVLASTIRWVHTLDDTPLPDPAFAERLESELIHDMPSIRVIPSAPAFAGETLPRSTVSPTPWTALTRRRLMNTAAAAALLAIVLASVIVSLRGASRVPRDEVDFPLVLGPGITDETLLLQARFEDFPEGVLSATVDRWVLPPGSEIQMGTRQFSGEGPSAYLVESGTLTIQADGPIAVTRSGTTMPVVAEAASQLELHTGDRGFAPSGVVSQWQNTAATPLRILEAKFRTVILRSLRGGVLGYTVVVEDAIPTPEHPVVMTVFQITLQPEAVLTADTISGLEMLKVESGRLVAVDVD
nr:hypothetical protein [Chloroflexia bacterium]